MGSGPRAADLLLSGSTKPIADPHFAYTLDAAAAPKSSVWRAFPDRVPVSGPPDQESSAWAASATIGVPKLLGHPLHGRGEELDALPVALGIARGERDTVPEP